MLSFSPLNSPIFHIPSPTVKIREFGDWLYSDKLELLSSKKIEHYIKKVVDQYYWKSINVDNSIIADLFRSNPSLIRHHSQIYYYLKKIHHTQRFDFIEFENFCKTYNVKNNAHGDASYYYLYEIASSVI